MGSMTFGGAEAGTVIRNFFLYSLTELNGCLLETGLFQVVRLANIKKKTVGREGP